MAVGWASCIKVIDMGDKRVIDRGVAGDKNADDALAKILAELDKNDRGVLRKNTGDLFGEFPRFGPPGKPRTQEFLAVSEEISWNLSRRNKAESELSPEKRDELRKARREYVCAKTLTEQAKYAKQIEDLVPGSAELNRKLAKQVREMDSLSTAIKKPDPYECMRCHPKPGGDVYEDPYKETRESLRNGYDQFFKPRKEDEFEAKWAQIALDSPVVKVNEILRQLPPVKLSSDDPVKLIKMGLTTAGIELDAQSREIVEQAVGGIKEIAKEGGSKFVIRRAADVRIPFADKTDVGGGIRLDSIQLGTIEFNIGEGKYPELKDIKGLKVNLDVPAYLSKLGQIDNQAEVMRLFFKRNPGTGDFEVNVEVKNPVPFVTRKIAKAVDKRVPDTPTITVPLMTLGPDGQRK